VEGALTVKSNRFLKLGAGGCDCEYPKFAYNEEEKTKKLKAAEKVSELKTNTGVATDGIVGLFKLTTAMTEAIFAKWEKRNEKCLSKKAALEKAIKELKEYANDEGDVCKTFDELKADLWNKTKEKIEEGDLGFKENVKVEGEAAQIVDDVVLGRFMFKKKDDIISLRKKARTAVVNAANALNTACNALSKFEITQDDVNKAIGFFRWSTLPKDAKEKMYNAINKDNCKGFKMFKSNEDEVIKSLTNKYRGLDENVTKKFRRLLCLNLLKEFKFVEDRVNERDVPEPTPENITTDDTWRDYVNSIQEIPELSKEGSMVIQTFKDAFTQTYSDIIDVGNLPKTYREKQAWSDGKDGTILIGNKNKTYRLDHYHDFITFDKIESYDDLFPDMYHYIIPQKNEYLKRIKETLLSI
jgi:hypothetical protein